MYSKQLLKEQIQNGELNKMFTTLYGVNAIPEQKIRYLDALDAYQETFDNDEALTIFSAPGRTEIGGNHTDHNHGRVIAAAVSLDVIAVVHKTGNDVIHIQSKGYPLNVVELDSLAARAEEREKSNSVIRGICARFGQLGYKIGGFEAYTTSNVLKGSGLSSSAAFEVLICTILNQLFNNGRISAVEIAQISQYAENIYFGKPSGLMDQTASSVGGVITIDFADNERPKISGINFDFNSTNTSLCIVNTGGNHADLTADYASLPADMKSVAKALGVAYLADTDYESLLPNITLLREQLGDRPILRALHFFAETDRVTKMVSCLNENDWDGFLSFICESGRSSFQYLQNLYSNQNPNEQGLSLALAIADRILNGKNGAWRVHGGGFGGTTFNLVPFDLVDEFKSTMETIFGENTCMILSFRMIGGCVVEA